MAKTYHIHPAIGIARLGNSTTQLCISPEKLGALPIDCDESGNARLTSDGKTERTISEFRDSEGRIKRQAGRFHICVHDNDYPGGRPLRIGDRIEGGGNNGGAARARAERARLGAPLGSPPHPRRVGSGN